LAASRRPAVQTFDLEKCLAHTKKYLATQDAVENSDDLIPVIRKRWVFVDSDKSGLCTYEELRQATWDSEVDNKGKGMPAGPLPSALQDIVDEIAVGTKTKAPNGDFDFWAFLAYIITEDQGIEGVTVPTPSEGWANARKL
jgi:hypothetical protein